MIYNGGSQLPQRPSLDNHQAGGSWLWQKVWNCALWFKGKRVSPVINQLPYKQRFKSFLWILFLGLCTGLGLRGLGLASFSGTYTGGPLNLGQPTVDSYDFGDVVNENFRIINSSWSALDASTTSLQLQITNINNTGATTYVNVSGDTMTGQLTLSASTLTVQGDAFSVGGSTFSIIGGSVTAFILQVSSPLASDYGGTGANMAGAQRGALPYFLSTGRQAALTPGTAGQVLQSGGAGADPSWTSSSLNERQGYVKDNFVGQVNGSRVNFNLSSTPTSAGALQVILDGLLQASTSDYTYTAAGQFITMSTAPAANSYSFYVAYSSGVTFIQSDGTDCSAGQAPRGVDAAGNAQNCFVAGDLLAASSSSISGWNTFKSSTSFHGPVYLAGISTIGPVGYASAVTKSSGILSNMMMIVASTNPTTGTSSITITGLQGSRMYEFKFSYQQLTAAARPMLRFNNDVTDTRYKWTFDGISTNGGALLNTGDNSDESCQLSNANTAINGYFVGTCDVYTMSVSTAVAVCRTAVADDGNPHMSAYTTSCKYNSNGTSAVSAISLWSTAGSFSGFAYLRELLTP